MAVFIQQYSKLYRSSDQHTYTVRVYGQERKDGVWEGWLEFHPLDDESDVLRTGSETTQPTRRALESWAAGIEPIYFDGAFERTRIAS